MRYCTRCLYPANHPLGITFDDAGVCSGCRVHEEKDQLDWAARGDRLRALFDGFRNRSGQNYDCIVPVSGGRDSYFIVDTVKRMYGMNPLLVTYNKHYNTRVGVRNLAYLRTQFDCDLLTLTVDPATVKKLTRASLRRRASIYWHCIAGQTVFPVQVAVRFKVPLIVWGVHQGVDQVGMFSHLDEVEMTRKYRKDHDLMGLEAEDLVGEFDNIKERDVVQYRYPHDKDIEAVGVRGIYLSNYVRWDSKAQHEAMIRRYGYEGAPQNRTFDTYNDVDCWHYSDLHDDIKFQKLGYGKAIDHACREIRLKRLSREAGLALVERHQANRPAFGHRFLSWIGMNEAGLQFYIDLHRDRRIWAKNPDGSWTATDSVTRHAGDPGVEAVRLGVTDDCVFQPTPSREPEVPDDRYILLGKGHVDARDRSGPWG